MKPAIFSAWQSWALLSACFAALLGGQEHGRWLISPSAKIAKSSRRYRDETLVLETDFETDAGAVRLIDFMPPRDGGAPQLVRIVEGLRGEVPMMMELAPRFDYGSLTATYRSLADRTQQQIGVPYLLFDGSLSAIPAVYARVGELLGAGDRGRELGRYAERLLAETDRRVARVPTAQRPRVYYARGPKGLETAARGSINVESLERLGARNVAGMPGGLAVVSPEQVLGWDPEIVIAIDPTFVASVRADPLWKNVRAVRDGRVYLVPQAPFPWVDFPPSVNRLIGLKWLGRIFYPEQFPEDLRQETRAFYTLFYHQAPTEAQLDTLLAGVERPRP